MGTHRSVAVTPGQGGPGKDIHTVSRTLADASVVEVQVFLAGGAAGAQSTRVASVSTTAAVIATALDDRVALMIHNSGTVRVYLGGATVTADDTAATGGWILEPGEKIALSFSAELPIYGRTASGTGTVRVWQVS